MENGCYASLISYRCKFGVNAWVNHVNFGGENVVQLDEVGFCGLGVGDDAGGGTAVVARAPAQISELLAGMRFWEVVIAQVMNGGDAGAAIGVGNDVGGRKKNIWRVLVKFAGEADVGPEAALGENGRFHMRCIWEKSIRRRLIEIET